MRPTVRFFSNSCYEIPIHTLERCLASKVHTTATLEPSSAAMLLSDAAICPPAASPGQGFHFRLTSRQRLLSLHDPLSPCPTILGTSPRSLSRKSVHLVIGLGTANPPRSAKHVISFLRTEHEGAVISHQHAKPVEPTDASQSTFLYHKLPLTLIRQVPRTWSNSPTDLELALPLHSKFQSQCPSAPDIHAPIPILVRLCPGHERVRQYLFEAAGRYYIHSVETGVVWRIVRPVDLERVLQGLEREGALGMAAVKMWKRRRRYENAGMSMERISNRPGLPSS